MRLRLRGTVYINANSKSTLARGSIGKSWEGGAPDALAERFYRMLAAHPPSQAWNLTSDVLCPPFQKKV
jgi:hypothetical protein